MFCKKYCLKPTSFFCGRYKLVLQLVCLLLSVALTKHHDQNGRESSLWLMVLGGEPIIVREAWRQALEQKLADHISSHRKLRGNWKQVRAILFQRPPTMMSFYEPGSTSIKSPKQWPKLRTKCSNPGAHERHISFKPPQLVKKKPKIIKTEMPS